MQRLSPVLIRCIFGWLSVGDLAQSAVRCCAGWHAAAVVDAAMSAWLWARLDLTCHRSRLTTNDAMRLIRRAGARLTCFRLDWCAVDPAMALEAIADRSARPPGTIAALDPPVRPTAWLCLSR